MNESAVNLVARIADDVLAVDCDRRMLPRPRNALAESGRRYVITATIGIINRQFRLARQIDLARLDGYGWNHDGDALGAFALRQPRIKLHGLTWGMNHEPALRTHDLSECVHKWR